MSNTQILPRATTSWTALMDVPTPSISYHVDLILCAQYIPTIHVAREGSALDKFTLFDFLDHIISVDKMIVLSILLPLTWLSGSVYNKRWPGHLPASCAQLQSLPFWQGNLRETLKPKVSGYSAKSFFNRVDFPEPDGPERTKIWATALVMMNCDNGESKSV